MGTQKTNDAESTAEEALDLAADQAEAVADKTLEEAAEKAADASSVELAENGSGDLTFSDADEDLDSEDSLTFSNGVIEKIVAIAVRDVPGVLGMKGGFFNRVQETFGASDPTKGVSVEVMPDNSVRVNISVLIEYGAYAPQVFEDVKKVVVKQVVGMTGLEVGGVNLRIEDVLTPEEYERMRRGRTSEDDPAEGEAE
ncbi:Asp23/Gls24 family envelope stress response protein [uncultured Parolsenella sp.]|uniref:Asp23/Gls24 family envelope stress response protein n=1 Tax=uncultured Parolsenella sp. TaxID=2083008 RepID=UPI0025CF5DD9|nr:Asp23/Gls24 family envelope stress response protein [uncultured Parolsenella sp.]